MKNPATTGILEQIVSRSESFSTTTESQLNIESTSIMAPIEILALGLVACVLMPSGTLSSAKATQRVSLAVNITVADPLPPTLPDLYSFIVEWFGVDGEGEGVLYQEAKAYDRIHGYETMMEKEKWRPDHFP